MTLPPIVPGEPEPNPYWPPAASYTTDPFTDAAPPSRRTRPALVATIVGLVLVVGGLSAWLAIGRGEDGAAAQVPAAATASSSAQTAPKASAAAAGAKAKTLDLKLGAKVKVPADATFPSATVQVIEYKRDTRFGDALDAVRIRVCLGTERSAETTVTANPWSLIYDGGESRHREISTGGPAPEYPFFDERKVRSGECVKGWLSFTDAPGEPEGVAYDLPASDFAASWRLP